MIENDKQTFDTDLNGCHRIAAQVLLNNILDELKEVDARLHSDMESDVEEAISAMNHICNIFSGSDVFQRDMQCEMIAVEVLNKHNITLTPEASTCVQLTSLGDFIAQGREQKGLSRREAAKLVGCSNSQLERIEKNQNTPSDELLAKICTCLDLPIDKTMDLAHRIKVGRYQLRKGVKSTPIKTLVQRGRNGVGEPVEATA